MKQLHRKSQGRKIVCLESKFLKNFVFYTAPSHVGILKMLLLFFFFFYEDIGNSSCFFTFCLPNTYIKCSFIYSSLKKKYKRKYFTGKKNRRELSLHLLLPINNMCTHHIEEIMNLVLRFFQTTAAKVQNCKKLQDQNVF